MVEHKTVVTPLLMHWSYSSHWYVIYVVNVWQVSSNDTDWYF